MKSLVRLLLFALIGIGIALRILSVGWNVIPHGDISLDARSAQAMYTQGNFQLSEDTTLPQADQHLIQHPPIWALLGAGMMHLVHVDAFTALKILSFLCGILIIPIMYRVSTFIFSKNESLFLASLISISWIMIDFSGNGALYSLQALLFLVWINCAIQYSTYKVLQLALISSIAYLTNYQTIILIPASILLIIIENRSVWKFIILYSAIFGLIISPWLVRNHLLFGRAFFGHTINATYLYIKAGLDSPEYIRTAEEKIIVLKMILSRWIPFNIYFAARKLFILAPILFIPFAYAFTDYPFSKKRIHTLLPILLVFILHLGISTAWPIIKFRYFVPLLPLVLIIGTEHLMQLKVSLQRKYQVLGVTLLCFLVLSFLSYQQIPTHTYYYDGAITQDAFHGEGEIQYMIDHGIL